jgi:hypothetical protein
MGILWSLLLLVAGSVVLFWPLLFHVKHVVPFHVLAGDPALTGIDVHSDRPDWRSFDLSPVVMFYSEKAVAARALHRGELPLWNPYNAVGVPLLANAQSQPFAPFFLPFMAFPNPWCYSLLLLIQLLFGGFGAALLLRKLGAGTTPQVFAALLFAFNPYALNYLVYSDVWAYVWFPWVFLAAERWVRRESGVAVPALLIALMGMSGHVESAFFGAASAFAYLAVRLFQKGAWRGQGRGWLLLPVLAAALSAWWLAPFAQYVLHCTTGRFGGNVCYPYHPSAAFIVGSEVFWPPVLLMVAAIAFMVPGKRRFALALLPGLLWSLVMMFPFPLALQEFATFDLLSGRYGRSVAWFVLVVAAGLGLDAVSKAEARRWTIGVSLAVSAAWLGLGYLLHPPSLAAAQANHWVPLQGTTMAHFPVLVALNVLALALVFLPKRWWAPPRLAASLAVLALACGLFFHPVFDVYWNDSAPEPAPAVRAALKGTAGRTWFPSQGYWKSFPPNVSAIFGIRDIRYSDPFTPKRLADVPWRRGPHQDLFESWGGRAESSFLGVDVAWGFAGRPDVAKGHIPALRPVILQPGAGRVLWVQNDEVEAGAGEALAAARADGAWEHTVFLETQPRETPVPSLGTSAPARIRAVETGFNVGVWEIDAPEDGWLLERDLYWPGWKAVRDGRTTDLYAADGIFRAVFVPAGRHMVTVRYRPLSFIAGVLVTLLCLLGSIAYRWMGRR